LPTLAAKGLILVPVTAVVKARLAAAHEKGKVVE
jgi:hypothetical protein